MSVCDGLKEQGIRGNEGKQAALGIYCILQHNMDASEHDTTLALSTHQSGISRIRNAWQTGIHPNGS